MIEDGADSKVRSEIDRARRRRPTNVLSRVAGAGAKNI